MVKNNPDPNERRGTWGSREAAAEYLRGAAARAEVFEPATERMLDLANMRPGSRVLDVGAGAGDQILAAARRVGPTGFCWQQTFPPACWKPPLSWRGRQVCRMSAPR